MVIIPDYPDDADGDALRRVASHGSNMAEPMEVDFMVAVPDEASGQRVAAAASDEGYEARVVQDEIGIGWTCYCTMRMRLTYETVVSAQIKLARLAAEHGGQMDGWGTFGNATSNG